MTVIGLTGGIGSGKSTVAGFFKEIGVSIYEADIEAKKIMQNNPEVKNKVTKLLGEKAYQNGVLNRTFIADKIFNTTALLHQLNAIVHPAVASHFEDWKQDQDSSYVIKEVAILFEHGGHLQCDATILVCAPLEIRIARVMQRDQVAREKVYDRIRNQWDDQKKIPLADYIINNVSLVSVKTQVQKIHQQIVEKYKCN